MTAQEEPKGSKTRVRVYNFTKLALAIGALTTAINGYIQIRKDQNNMLEVISDKVDAIVLKVAYLEGRIEGLSPKEAAKEAERRVAPAPTIDASAPVPEVTVTEHLMTTSEHPSPGRLPSVSVPEAPHSVESAVAKANKQLYQQMPRDLDTIQMVVDQKIMKLDNPAEAAPPEESP